MQVVNKMIKRSGSEYDPKSARSSRKDSDRSGTKGTSYSRLSSMVSRQGGKKNQADMPEVEHKSFTTPFDDLPIQSKYA